MANPLLVFQGSGPPEGSANRSCGSSPTPSRPISYGIPTFKLHGTALLWFARWKAHCSIYPLTDSFLAEHADELEGYRRTKGSVHFTPEAPLPEALVEELVRARVADLEARGG